MTRSAYNVTAAPYNADPTGTADATAAIQSAINDASAMGGGKVIVPAGTFWITGPLVVPQRVILEGHGRWATYLTSKDADVDMIVIAGSYNAVRDMAIQAKCTKLDGTPGHSPITVNKGAVSFALSGLVSWGGAWGICDLGGVDGTIYDVNASGFIGAVGSAGANKYQSCKFDTGALPTQQFGLYLFGDAAYFENSFDQCDVSGNFTSCGVCINDNSPVSMVKFTDCIFGAPVNLMRAKAVMFTACEMPPANQFTLGAGVGCSITGCYALGGPTTYPACAKAGNINIA